MNTSSSSPLTAAAGLPPPLLISLHLGNVLSRSVRLGVYSSPFLGRRRPLDLDATTVKLTDLASCGGCAAKYSAARLEQLLAGFVPGRGREPARGARARRRRRRLPAGRRARHDLHARLLPADRRRPGGLRRRSRRRTLSTTCSPWAARLSSRSRSRRSPRSCRSRCSAQIFAAADETGSGRGRPARRRTHDPRRGAQVRARGDRQVHPDGIWTKSTAQPGDAVYVTKPLGTGLIMTGHKRGAIGTQQLERAVGWMKTLNEDAADVLRTLRVTPSPMSPASASSATPTR